MTRRAGPKRTFFATLIERSTVTILSVMMVSGLGLVLWTIKHLPGPHTETSADLAFMSFAASVFLTGITTIYCGLTGFILLENRRMRVQAVMPHVQMLSPVRSAGAVTMELQNSGSAPAVDVEIHAWILTRVNNTRTPEAALYYGTRPALPATQAPARMQLTPSGSATQDFESWKEHFTRASVPADSLDVLLLLVHITYGAVDGSTMSECMAHPLADQPVLPGGQP